MKLHLVNRPTSRGLLAICVATAVVVSVSLTGCVRSPREFISSLRGEVAQESSIAGGIESKAESADESGSIATAEHSLLNSTTESAIRPVSFRRSTAAADVVQADSAHHAEFKQHSENLLGSILEQRQQDLKEAGADPFLRSSATAAAQTQQGIADGGPFPKSIDSTRNLVHDRSTNRFASGFDARLARLRDDLDARSERAVAGGVSQANVVTLPVWAQPQPTTASSAASRAESAAAAPQTTPPPRLPWTEKNATPHDPPEAADAKQRVQTLLRQSEEDWEHARPRDAYKKAVQAKELAVLEHVNFAASEQQPGDIAERIAAAIHSDTVSATSRQTQGEWPGHSTIADAAAKPTADIYSARKPTNPNEVSASSASETSEPIEQTAAFATEPLVSNGGVKLLRPIADTLPTEAEASSDPTGFGLLRHRQAIKSAFVSHNRPNRNRDFDHASLAEESEAHHGPGLLRRSTETLRPLPLLSSQECVPAATGDVKSGTRELEGGAIAWPKFSSPNAATTDGSKYEPLRVAKAPPLLINQEAVSAHSNRQATAGLHRPSLGRSDSGWPSQIPWIIGGILLLIIAMRLTSWTPAES